MSIIESVNTSLIPLVSLDTHEGTHTPLRDQHQRDFTYLRLSITDVCNYRCNYCLPDGYQCKDKTKPLSITEIKTLITTFAKKGIKKVRITGGEPSLRKDLPEIIRVIKETQGIETVALTTNGYKLQERVESWVEAGLDSLNLSIDSLQPELFKTITGHDRLAEIMSGLEKALSLNLSSIKVNAVLLKTYNLNQFDDFLNWIKVTPISMRFIELMETSDNREYFKANHVQGKDIQDRLEQSGWIEKLRGPHAGPAKEYTHPNYQGSVGLIMPYSKDFCKSCNRLRVSAFGKLHLCLFGEQGYDLRSHLNGNDLSEHLDHILLNKSEGHELAQHQTGATKHLAMLGG